MEFFPAPFHAPLRAFASVMFAFDGDNVLIADIKNRGWCVPSGRVEPFENSSDAAVREAAEEGGARVVSPVYIGAYRLAGKSEVRWVDTYVATIAELHEIRAPQESRDRKIVPVCQVNESYHFWDPLMEAVFAHAYEVWSRGQRS